MAWLILSVSGLLETLWAVALKQSDGFSKPGWIAVFAVAATLSLGGLMIALKDLPVGTAYAVWTGIGTVGAALVGVLVLSEPLTALRALGIALIVGGVVVLRLAGLTEQPPPGGGGMVEDPQIILPAGRAAQRDAAGAEPTVRRARERVAPQPRLVRPRRARPVEASLPGRGCLPTRRQQD